MSFKLFKILTRMSNQTMKLTGIFTLAMLLGGEPIRKDFYEMTSELIQVHSRDDFAQWLTRSHYRMFKLTQINWRPISMFPEERKSFK